MLADAEVRTAMYQVLVPVDENERRTRAQTSYVARLADGSANVAAAVLFVAPPDAFARAEEVDFEEIGAAVEAADRLEATGVQVNRAVGDGGVAGEVVRIADAIDADELVMGGRKRSGVTSVLLGSTVQDVILSTERSVTVTGESAALGEGTRHLLVPVGRNVGRARNQAVYVSGLPGAPENVEATVLYVFPHQDYKGAPEHEFEEVEAAVDAAERLESAGIDVERAAVGGEVTRKIFERAENGNVDGIVVGGRKRSGVQKALLGSTVQDVLLSAERPVTITG
jgi:nucleotide-binding universal stress UspA family protein